jgi:hypothetical protein
VTPGTGWRDIDGTGVGVERVLELLLMHQRVSQGIQPLGFLVVWQALDSRDDALSRYLVVCPTTIIKHGGILLFYYFVRLVATTRHLLRQLGLFRRHDIAP